MPHAPSLRRQTQDDPPVCLLVSYRPLARRSSDSLSLVESLASVTAVGVAPGASDAFAASTFSREYFISTATKAGSALAI